MRSRLGVRSAYSLLYGVRRNEDLIARAAAYGAAALAITDRDSLYGVHEGRDAAAAAKLRLVIGAELTVTAPEPRADEPCGMPEPPGATPGVFAFVKDRAGFGRLCELLSAAKRAAGAVPGSFDLLAALRADSAGLILASGRPEVLDALAGRVPSLYAALTPHSLAAAAAARRLGIPLAALDDATFLDTDDWAVHSVLRAVALGKTVGTLAEGDRAASDAERFLPGAEVERRLAAWPEALRAADEIVAACAFEKIFDGYVFPDYGGEDGRSPAELLRRRVMEGAAKRYGELTDVHRARIDKELNVIERKGFAPYFLVMDDIVAMTSRTCGRGSGAASIVSYALSITNVDPVKYDLYFERFLNMARPDPPDIDVDFAWDERDELIRRVIERFGRDRCARVANHNTFRPRSALRETAKAYGLAEGEIARVERSVFALAEAADTVDPVWTEVFSLARRIEGLPRGLSMHCGGLVIAPGPIDRYAPIESSAEGFPLLAWEKEGTEAAGLVKIDLLGNRSLAVIRDALANLEEEGVRIDPFSWKPAEDEATIAALARGDSLGVFYIESPAMRQLQKKTGKGDFDHIVIHSSLIRPAANKFIAEYVRRLKGGAWKPLHPLLADSLAETFGILCYQEDVSKTAIALAGFDEVDADRLRKVIAKKSKGGKLAEYEERFRAGCAAKGVDAKVVDEVWPMMLSFDGYSFCKPHSASYAMVSFQSAWLRVHHPAAFMAAVLSNQGGYYHPQAYISEARRMGLRVAGPDVNRSRIPYRGEGDCLVVGLMAIAKLSQKAREGLVAEREKRGPFADLADFSRRCGALLSREDILSLTAAGAFDSLAPDASRATQARVLLVETARSDRSGTGQEELFAPARPGAKLRPAAPAAKRTKNELREELAALGFLRSRHPLVFWADAIMGLNRVKAADLGAHIGSKVALVGWQITRKEVWTSKDLPMVFVSFEDETALYETVLFPEAYERHWRLLLDARPLLLWGTVTDDQGAVSVEVERMRPLEGAGI